MTAGPDRIGDGWAALSWQESPRVFWYHTVTPKAGAKVLLSAGGKPLLVAGTFGKGRVAVFAGSVMGDPPAGRLPFWDWQGWPAVLSATMAWLTADSGKDNSTFSAEAKAQLKTRFLGAGVKKADVLVPEMLAAAHQCGDRDTAELLLRAVANLDDDASLELVDAVSSCTHPFIDAGCADAAELLKNSGQTNKISLALRVLGQLKAAPAKALLESALKEGEVAHEGGGGDDDLLNPDTKVAEDDKERAYAIRLGALEGLANLADPGETELLDSYVAQYAKTRQKPADFPKTDTPDDELYQQALLAALHCGDANAAAPAIDAILQNRYLFVTLSVILDQPLEDPQGAEAFRLEQARVQALPPACA